MIRSLGVNATRLQPGAQLVFEWDIMGDDTVTIEPDVGTFEGDLTTRATASPTETATYTITVSNANGTLTREITVEILPEMFAESRIFSLNAAPEPGPPPVDLDGDGDPDIVLESYGRDGIFVMLNEAGEFGEPLPVETAIGPAAVSTGDIDGDGDEDIISYDVDGYRLAWHPNNGDATFAPPITIPLQHPLRPPPPHEIIVLGSHLADIDGDGDLDLFIASARPSRSRPHFYSWFEQFDDGSFSAERALGNEEAFEVNSVTSADLDGDGQPEIITGSQSITIHRFLENGTFDEGVRLQQANISVRGRGMVTVVDFDGDGAPDLLSGAGSSDRVVWYRNRGDGTFGDEIELDRMENPGSVIAADLDLDGDPDIVASSRQDGISWWANYGDGRFSEKLEIIHLGFAAPSINDVEASDIDGDGDLDILYPRSNPGLAEWRVIENLVIDNTPPAVATSLPDLGRDEDDPTFSVAIGGVFTDAQDAPESLSLEVTASPEGIASAEISPAGDGLIITPQPNAFGTVEIALRATDQGGLSAETSFSLTVNPVNDRPGVRNRPDPVTATPDAAPLQLDLGETFLDVDGDPLTIAVGTPEGDPIVKLPTIDDGLQMHIEFEPYAWGDAIVTVSASDPEGETAEVAIRVTLPKPPAPEMELVGELALNRQTGLFEQRVRLHNSAARAIGGTSIELQGLAAPIELYNRSGMAGETTPFVTYGQPVSAGETIELVFEFYSPDRSLPTASFHSIAILPEPADAAPPGGFPTRIERVIALEGGAMLVEFPSIPGRRYRVDYTGGDGTWLASPIHVRAAGSRLQVIDRGAPLTESPPGDIPTRLYRISELSE